ncbi:putative -like protein [Eutypa lata UCREL1]|uniref:Putative-like protein n=1 Tax=Eutypa lata (strain UCR-EL1) TaxID=1287681 RepID=M7TVQ1_EUTLA|nr:putative -like protein [Eutypa lata UCREL1]
MLVLIAGITGMCGQPLAQAALAKGHRVRGLGRNPDKLALDLSARLEGFAKMKDIYDIAALDRAVQGADAVICAYNPSPELIVEGQILLLRAAERAGVKIFHAASWNMDWTRNRLGDHETYDCYIAFCNHARISSPINPLYAFTGTILEWELQQTYRPKTLDGPGRIARYFGTGRGRLPWTSADDLAAYTIEAISSPTSSDGGFYRVHSFRASVLELADAYEKVRGGGVEIKRACLGSAEELEAMLRRARKEVPPYRHAEYVGLAYAKYMLDGIVQDAIALDHA